ncbi:hypothetical protein E2C01_036942 [Portunus trituberculatus]|uniref:Uncharacterized protein n=1 Tax=Portunus trituberculatus TaxID=210409 RepID=A0A5B7FE17_PORTR|nr:hypothetical protein [Portunus trituberculatus]
MFESRVQLLETDVMAVVPSGGNKGGKYGELQQQCHFTFTMEDTDDLRKLVALINPRNRHNILLL